jgi:starch phosphorylase
MSNKVFALQVSPRLPPSLRRLDDLASNFWFSWSPQLGQLFGKLDSKLWRKVEGSPRRFLRSVDQSILEHAAGDPRFLAELEGVLGSFDRYLGSRPPAPYSRLTRP